VVVATGAGTNWAGNVTYRATAVHHPTSVAQVQELVAGLSRVRALGTRHSFSPVADYPGGALIALSGLAAGITVDAAARTVSVSASTRYGELAAALHAGGYALANMGSLPHISVAGAIATGTHGSGDGNGILATSVAALDIVRADGSLATVDRCSKGRDPGTVEERCGPALGRRLVPPPDSALSALAVGLGMFGVVVRLVLDVEPTYRVRQDVYVGASWDAVLDAFDEVMAGAYSVSLLGDPGSPVVAQLWQKSKVPDGPDPPPAPRALHGGTWYDDAGLPPGHALNPRAGVVGPWSERLPHFRLDAPPSVGGDELQTEYFVDRCHAVAALRAVRALGARISPHLHAAEIRTVAADELWLSPAYRRDSVCLGFTWRRHPEPVAALMTEVEAALAPFEPRPHWGKLHRIPLHELERRFPRLPDALALACSWDPAGKFGGGLRGD
jgi:alditol oxidase